MDEITGSEGLEGIFSVSGREHTAGPGYTRFRYWDKDDWMRVEGKYFNYMEKWEEGEYILIGTYYCIEGGRLNALLMKRINEKSVSEPFLFGIDRFEYIRHQGETIILNEIFSPSESEPSNKPKATYIQSTLGD